MDSSIVFARWCQCTLPWGNIGATWRIWFNLCFLWPTRIHSPNCKSIGSAIFAQITVEWPRAHWHHLVNTIELVLSSAHPTPQPKWQINQLQLFLHSSQQKVPIFYNGMPRFPKIAPSCGVSGPHLIYASLGQSDPTTQTASPSVQPLLHRYYRVYLYFTMGRPFPLKLPLPVGDLDHPHLICGSVGPPESSTQTASRWVEPFSQCSLIWQTNRLTMQLSR